MIKDLSIALPLLLLFAYAMTFGAWCYIVEGYLGLAMGYFLVLVGVLLGVILLGGKDESK